MYCYSEDFVREPDDGRMLLTMQSEYGVARRDPGIGDTAADLFRPKRDFDWDLMVRSSSSCRAFC